jgi:hypothetical protein
MLIFKKEAMIVGIILACVFGLLSLMLAKSIKELLGELKKDIEKEKNNGKSLTQKRLTKLGVGFLCAWLAILAFGLGGYGKYEAGIIDSKAELLMENKVNEDIFVKINEFDVFFDDSSFLGKLFYSKSEAVEAFKGEADQFLEREAAKLENKISQLEKLDDIHSDAQYNDIRNTLIELKLSSSEYDLLLKEKVSNYSDLEAYEKTFEQICQKYAQIKKCSICSGTGKEICENCGGKGEYDIWTNATYPCDKCSGKGRFRCGSCSGTGKITVYDFEK